MQQLNQVIAIEKGIKARANSELTEIHKISTKVDLFNGFTKTYQKKDEEGEEYPQEKKKVIYNVTEQLSNAAQVLTEMLDVTAVKDFTNGFAVADLEVNGLSIAKNAPVSYLLFLEKQVNDIRTFVEKLPTLDESEDWIMDVNSGQYKTNPISTHKTKKVQKPIILAEATKEHPAQCQMITEDVVVGYWDTVKYSGAIPIPKKKLILERIETFSSAVKCAREKANCVKVQEIKVGNAIFDYLFK